jgi:hypothetical protein
MDGAYGVRPQQKAPQSPWPLASKPAETFQRICCEVSSHISKQKTTASHVHRKTQLALPELLLNFLPAFPPDFPTNSQPISEILGTP